MVRDPVCGLEIAERDAYATRQLDGVQLSFCSAACVRLFDAATNKVITTLTGVEGPHNLQVAPDGRSVWAVSGHESLALMIDPTTYQLHGTVATGKEPAHIILVPDGKTAYVTNGDDDTVTAIDVATMKAIATIPVGAYPHGLRPSLDGKWVYVANAKGTTHLAEQQVVATIPVDAGPNGISFAPLPPAQAPASQINLPMPHHDDKDMPDMQH
jgi:YVTN family beta-propeller protein